MKESQISFARVGAHQCDILMDVLECIQLVAYVVPTIANTCGFYKSREGGYSLRTGAKLKGSLYSVALCGDNCLANHCECL